MTFAALPSTSNYKLNSYGIGSGGTANSTTSNYALEGITGELSGQTSFTANYKVKPGFIETQQAHLPILATFDNPSNYYNKLRFIINQQGNPTDALYALAISTDNFVADTRYVKSDLTVGPTLTLSDYKTYSAWGGASGNNIIGLSSGTTYYLKVKATQGKFTESGFGPVSSAATVNPQLSFAVTTDSQSSPPFLINFGSLTPGIVTDSPDHINLSLSTNAASGGKAYISSQEGGLKSIQANYTIVSATADLSSGAEGFGAQSTSATQSSGGPLTVESPYNGTGNNVGIINSTIRPLYATAGPITGGAGSLLLKAKAINTTPSAGDYAEIITIVAAVSF